MRSTSITIAILAACAYVPARADTFSVAAQTISTHATTATASTAAASSPATTAAPFTPINHYDNGAYYNLASCAQPCIIAAQTDIGCANANCLCSKTDDGMNYVRSCVEVNCKSDCDDVAGATSLLAGFCESVAQNGGFTLPTITSAADCEAGASSLASQTSLVTTPLASSLTVPSIASSTPSSSTSQGATGSTSALPETGWTRDQKIDIGVGIGLAVLALPGVYFGWKAYRDHEQHNREERAARAYFELR